jgi:hypothetical protein
MALFKSLFNWAVGNKPPKYLQPNLKSQEQLAKESIATGEKLLPEVQGLEAERNEFLTGQISNRLNLFAPWLSSFGETLGQTSTALVAGQPPPDIAQSYERAGRAAAFSSGFGYAPKAISLAGLFGAEGALRGIALGTSTAESWLSLMNNIYAPATVNYADKYLPSTAQTTQYETSRELVSTAAKNQARQFKFATDPLREVYSDVGNTLDTIGSALSVYLGGLGGIGGMAGGLVGAASGGGGASAGGILGGMGMGGGKTSGWMADEGGWTRSYTSPGWFGFGGKQSWETQY